MHLQSIHLRPAYRDKQMISAYIKLTLQVIISECAKIANNKCLKVRVFKKEIYL